MPLTPEQIDDQRLRAYAEEVLAWKQRYDAERAAHQETQDQLARAYRERDDSIAKMHRDHQETQAIVRELLEALETNLVFVDPGTNAAARIRSAIAKAKAALPQS